jgi:hypothetical protein
MRGSSYGHTNTRQATDGIRSRLCGRSYRITGHTACTHPFMTRFSLQLSAERQPRQPSPASVHESCATWAGRLGQDALAGLLQIEWQFAWFALHSQEGADAASHICAHIAGADITKSPDQAAACCSQHAQHAQQKDVQKTAMRQMETSAISLGRDADTTAAKTNHIPGKVAWSCEWPLCLSPSVNPCPFAFRSASLGHGSGAGPARLPTSLNFVFCQPLASHVAWQYTPNRFRASPHQVLTCQPPLAFSLAHPSPPLKATWAYGTVLRSNPRCHKSPTCQAAKTTPKHVGRH